MSNQFALTGRCGSGIQELSRRLAESSSSYKKEGVKQETAKQETAKQEAVKQEAVKQETAKQETVKATPLVRIFTDFDGTLNPSSRKIDKQSHFKAVEAMKRESEGLLELNITTGRIEKAAEMIIRGVGNRESEIPAEFVRNGLIDNIIACDGGFAFKVDNEEMRLVYNDEMNQETSSFIEEKSNYTKAEVENIIDSKSRETLKETKKYYDSKNQRFILTYKTEAASINAKNSIEGELQARGIKAKTTLGNVTDTQSYFKGHARNQYLKQGISTASLQAYFNKYLYIKPLTEEEIFDKVNLAQEENVLQIIPDVRDFTTNKHIQVMQGIEQAKKEGGLVIAMGNDVNDFTMLNPLTYVLPAGMKLPDNEKDACKLLRENPQLKDDIEALPLRLSLIGKDMQYNRPEMYKMFKFFAQEFPDQFIMTDEYNYDNHDNDYYTNVVKKSIYSYGMKNLDFMGCLAGTPSFWNYVLS